ncbi:MAG TPA: TonB family protein [Chthoniobacterales bacterium]|nr:TonB family protein [Chthoniobacterales bacterium]
MRQSTLALVCGLILFVVLAYSWCGRNPPPPVTALPATPTPTPPPVAVSATPQVAASPSVSVAQATASPPAQTPPPEFQKVAQKAAPAIIEITVFDAKGELLRTGNAFFVSRDGLIVTSGTMVADAAYGVAKSPDGKIRNIAGVLASDQQNDLAVLRAETKVGVPFLPLAKTSESIAVNAWAVVISSSLQRKEQPAAAGTITSLGADPKKDAFQINGSIPNEAAGSPVVDADSEVVGIVTSAAKDGLRPSALLDPLLAQAKSETTGRWAAAPVESPTVSPTPTPKFVRNPRVLYNPAPRYPYQARMLRSGPTTGSGKFRVTFDANGQVKNVQTLESTGQGLLDSAAIDALRHWKAEAGGRDWTVIVPVTFRP